MTCRSFLAVPESEPQRNYLQCGQTAFQATARIVAIIHLSNFMDYSGFFIYDFGGGDWWFITQISNFESLFIKSKYMYKYKTSFRWIILAYNEQHIVALRANVLCMSFKCLSHYPEDIILLSLFLSLRFSASLTILAFVIRDHPKMY